MGSVFADAHSWLSAPGQPPFEIIPLQTFENLRTAVNDGSADFFMWEHFTSKRYYDNGTIKKLGEIYTPWSSGKIVARDVAGDVRLDDLFEKIDKGIEYFANHKDEAVTYISTELDYSEEDAREWLGTVRFAERTKGVNLETVEATINVLKKAGVLQGDIDPGIILGRAQETS